ncbi:MAG TPA: hypothetical protein VNQ50_00635 [Xanthobacteraceae bacterium]|nr:hypothetical protein [Xanthobacteraceae bacterium]
MGEPAAGPAGTGAGMTASTTQGTAQQGTTHDVAQDTALILDALARMETTIREERAALSRLRQGLADMARAVARAKAERPQTAASGDSAATTMLDELEHHIDAMLEIAGGGFVPAPPQAAEPDQVPTVSGVVSQLGPAADAQHHDTPQDTATDNAASHRDDTGADAPGADPQDVPTVSMLKAMVEALNAAAPSETPEAPANGETAQSGESDMGEADPTAAPHTAPGEPGESASSERPQAEDAPRDPLAPLRAMSEDERIALFS